jgi:hypothetical protein
VTRPPEADIPVALLALVGAGVLLSITGFVLALWMGLSTLAPIPN